MATRHIQTRRTSDTKTTGVAEHVTPKITAKRQSAISSTKQAKSIAIEANPTAAVAKPVRGRKRKADTSITDNGETHAATTIAKSTSTTSRKKRVTKATEQRIDPISVNSIDGSNVEDRPTKRTKTTTTSSKKKGTSKRVNGKAASKAAEVDSNDSPSSSDLIWKFGTVSRSMEDDLRSNGKTIILGVDEAGRGPLAGPVVASAIYIPPSVHFEGVNDSKILSEDQREELFKKLTTHSDIVHAVCVLDHEVIDRINILEATLLAMQTAVDDVEKQLLAKGHKIDYVLVDGNRLPKTLTHPCESVVKGDGRVYSIAAASIIAKVTRDRMMVSHHQTWPQYNFLQHKGYGVAAHMAAIHKFGPCPIHRMSFAPMKHMNTSKSKSNQEKSKVEAKPRQTKVAQRARNKE